MCADSSKSVRDENKQAEEALAAQAAEIVAAEIAADSAKRHLETLMEALPVGVAITDCAGKTVKSNAAIEQIWRMGRPASRACDHHGYQAWWPETGKPVLPDEWASARAIKQNQPVAGQFLKIARVDGSHAFVLNSAAPIREPDGTVVGGVAVIQDVTDLQHELGARERVSRLYAVLSRVNEAIVRCREERELHARVCRILTVEGSYPLAWIGHRQGDRIVPTACHGPASDYLDTIVVTCEGELGKGPTGTCMREGRAVVNLDFLTEQAMGPWRPKAERYGLRSSAAFPLTRNGVIVAALTLYAREPGAFDAEHVQLLEALAADLSYAQGAIDDEHRRALAEESLARSEALLRQADERKTQFLAVLSHELRNPLAPIKNSLHILDRTAPGGDPAKHALAIIKRQVDQLSHLVDDLLDVTRLTSGKLRLEREPIDLVEVAARVAEDHEPMLEAAGLAFAVELAPRPVCIDGDAARIAQVVGNLLTNAAKFTPRGGRVSLTVDEDGPHGALVRVKDTGSGIDPAWLPRMFEPFMQAENTLARSRGGLGLGLALVKGVVEMHGGTVEARSPGLAQGAEFILRLPSRDRPVAPVGERDQAARRPSPRRVLVIEDHADSAESLRDFLELDRHEVDVAYDGREGITKARAFKPDIVFCDIGLPGMNGYEVARAMRADESLHSAFLVALTGYAQPDDLARAAEAGFAAHLAKPASAQQIEEVLARATEHRAAASPRPATPR